MPVIIRSNWNAHALLVGMHNGIHLQNSPTISYKVNIHLLCIPEILFLDTYPREMETYIYPTTPTRTTCTCMFIAALFIIIDTWK